MRFAMGSHSMLLVAFLPTLSLMAGGPCLGRFLFVNAGLILQADSESELAGVMAHEIAHVAAIHGTKQADFLGLQYLNKAGYDPTSSVDFCREGAVHGTPHDRVQNHSRAERDQSMVFAKTAYIVNTSEFGVCKGPRDYAA